MAACMVAKRLYVGGQKAVDQVQELGITHVLSVVNYDVDVCEGVCHWRIDVCDDEAADLLSQLPAAVKWLELALRQKGSSVLVHCNAGVSRSIAVVAAAIIKSKGVSPTAALAALAPSLAAAGAPPPAPNPGFMEQLQLWADMGCELQEAHPAYRQWQLARVARQWQEEGWVDPGSFAELPQEEAELAKLVRYRCRKCRQLLVTEDLVVPADAAAGRRDFGRRAGAPGGGVVAAIAAAAPGAGGATAAGAVSEAASGGGSSGGGSGEAASLFVLPLSWMQDSVVGGVQGKLYCPKCSARLGSFNWSGISNTRGAWVTPAFQLHTARLDRIDTRPAAALAGLRLPAQLAERRPAPPAPDDFMGDFSMEAGQAGDGGSGDVPQGAARLGDAAADGAGGTAGDGAHSGDGSGSGSGRMGQDPDEQQGVQPGLIGMTLHCQHAQKHQP